MLTVVACGGGLASTNVFALAEPANKVDEASPAAAGLGYKQDTTKVDDKKFAAHKAANKCGGCQLYQGKAGDAWAACPLFAGKVVNANGWCSAWVKKA